MKKIKLTPLSFTKNSVVELSSSQMLKINAGDDQFTVTTGQSETVSAPKATVSRYCSQYCAVN